jgi:hypothetical protein
MMRAEAIPFPDRSPAMAGLLHGVVVSGLVAVALGLLGATRMDWFPLCMAVLAFGRPLRYQAVLALVLGAACAALSGLSITGVLIPVTVGLVVANLFGRSENATRWRSEHQVFSAVLLTGCLLCQCFQLPIWDVAMKALWTAPALAAVFAIHFAVRVGVDVVSAMGSGDEPGAARARSL